MRKDVSNPIIL